MAELTSFGVQGPGHSDAKNKELRRQQAYKIERQITKKTVNTSIYEESKSGVALTAKKQPA